MQLTQDVARAVQPLFDRLPLENAMTQLVVRDGATKETIALVESVLKDPAITPPLAAGLWLYIDELDRSHTISQSMKTPTGSFWHGIMHRREGDFGNSHYWFRNTGAHPAMAEIDGYDPHAFIDQVEARHKEAPRELADLQRREWLALFTWCARNPA